VDVSKDYRSRRGQRRDGNHQAELYAALTRALTVTLKETRMTE